MMDVPSLFTRSVMAAMSSGDTSGLEGSARSGADVILSCFDCRRLEEAVCREDSAIYWESSVSK